MAGASLPLRPCGGTRATVRAYSVKARLMLATVFRATSELET